MDKDLMKFENRTDDWLAKQKKEESYVSAWDFDEGKRIKQQHQENCEATQIKKEHEQKHQLYKEHMAEVKRNRVAPKNNTAIIPIIVIIITLTTIMLGFITSAVASGEAFFGLVPILIVVILLAAIVSGKRR